MCGGDFVEVYNDPAQEGKGYYLLILKTNSVANNCWPLCSLMIQLKKVKDTIYYFFDHVLPILDHYVLQLYFA